jgi:YVTN family beta-propeller protein
VAAATKARKQYVLTLFGIILMSVIVLPYHVRAQESSNLIVNPNTNKIYIYNNDNKSILVIDGETNKVISNIPLELSNSSIISIDPDTSIQILAVAGGFITAFVGLRTYYQSQMLRKKDILKDIVFPLKNDFDTSPEINRAKYILDDAPIEQGFYDEKRLLSTLRDHRNNRTSWEPGDGIVRGSFDRFLDFLGTLEYLSAIELIKKETQLYPFQYYIDKAAKNKALVNYVKIYNFPLYGGLHPNLNSKSPSTDTFNNP